MYTLFEVFQFRFFGKISEMLGIGNNIFEKKYLGRHKDPEDKHWNASETFFASLKPQQNYVQVFSKRIYHVRDSKR